MDGYDMLDKAMNVGYDVLVGNDITIEPNDSNEVEDMIFVPDPELTKEELAAECIEYFESIEEYEKCAQIIKSIN